MRTFIVAIAILLMALPAAGQDGIRVGRAGDLQKQAPEIYGMPGSHLLQQDWARIGPKLAAYAQQHEAEQGSPALRKAAWSFVVGSQQNWWATDLSNPSNNFEYSVPSTCRAVGVNCYIFVEDALWTGRVTQQTVDAVLNAFDSSTPANASKGIYQTDVESFGNPPNFDGDPKIIILILDIKDGWSGSGGYVAGYFYSINQYTEANVQASLGTNRHSNQGEIYYLDANPADLTTTAGFTEGSSTTAHEFQHMIHFNYDPDEISFVNEGMSESASRLCGYALRSPSLYYANTNVDFMSWKLSSDVLPDYSRTAIFSWYLLEQFGTTLTNLIVSRTNNGTIGYDDAFAAAGSSLRFSDVLQNFAVATFLNDKAFNARYGFTNTITGAPAPHRTHMLPNVAAMTDTLQPNGTRYIKFAGGDSLSITVTSSASLGVKAIAKGPAGKRVDAVTLGTPYVLGTFGTSYTELTLAVTNLSAATVTYTYSANGKSSVSSVELKHDAGEPTGYLQSAVGDTVCVWFDAVAGGRIDSIRVALRRVGSMTGGIWEYSGAVRPSPLGKPLATGLTAAVSSTPGIPYPVPWPAWATIDLRSYNLTSDKPFAVAFRCAGDPSTSARVMINETPLSGAPTSLTYSTTSSNGANWYFYTSNTVGDSVYAYLIRAYISFTPAAPAEVYPGDSNNDGLVDARDVLPIGRFYGSTGAVRAGGSLAWSPQLVSGTWSPPEACHADCDGNGTVNALDVQGIIENWGSTRLGGASVSGDRRAICEDLLRMIDAQGTPTGALLEIRNAVVNYMTSTLGIAFSYSLEQNWPNPFNPSTTIRFSLPENIPSARITVVNTLGQVVWEKELGPMSAGSHDIMWDGHTSAGLQAASGVYIYQLTAGTFHAARRMALIK